MSKEFVYIDSSQEQESNYYLYSNQTNKVRKDHNTPIIQHQEKGEGKADLHKQISNKNNGIDGNKNIQKSPVHRHCPAHNYGQNVLEESQYDAMVKNLLKQKIDKQVVKQLITNIEDAKIAQNINKRNANYRYFLEKVELDRKYRAMQQEKSDKLRQQNQRKKKVLYSQQAKDELRKQQAQLKKYFVQKDEKQKLSVCHIKKQIRKLGFERIYTAHKKMRQQIEQQQERRQNQIASKLNKQRNEILQLQQQFQALKEEKKINKLEHRKNIKQLTENTIHQKQVIIQKYTTKRPFQV